MLKFKSASWTLDLSYVVKPWPKLIDSFFITVSFGFLPISSSPWMMNLTSLVYGYDHHSKMRSVVFLATKILVDELLKSMSHLQSIFHLNFFPNAFPCLVGSLNGSLMCSMVHCSIKHLEMDGIIGFSFNFISFIHVNLIMEDILGDLTWLKDFLKLEDVTFIHNLS